VPECGSGGVNGACRSTRNDRDPGLISPTGASHWKRMVLPDGIELSRGTHSTLKSLSFFASPKHRVYQAGRSCHARLESLSTDVADRVTVRVDWCCVPHFESVYPNKWWDGGQGMRRRVGKKLYAHHSSAYFVGC